MPNRRLCCGTALRTGGWWIITTRNSPRLPVVVEHCGQPLAPGPSRKKPLAMKGAVARADVTPISATLPRTRR